MMLGIPVLFCGVVALNPHRRKHAINVASAIAFLGAVAGVSELMYSLFQVAGGNQTDRYGLNVIGVMSAICAVFVVICLVSLIQVRRRRAASAANRPVSSLSIVDTVVEDDQVSDVKSRESA
jgi:hypothetical protein